MAAISDMDVLHIMQRYGGSFASALAKAWQVADRDNQNRLKAAFGDLLAEYRELAEMKADRDSVRMKAEDGQ